MATKYWNGSAWVTPKMKIWDGARWADVLGGAKVKSVQHGRGYIAHGSKLRSVTINAVDMSKSIVISSFRGGEPDLSECIVASELVSSTQLNFHLKYASQYGDENVNFAWQVIEFESGVNVQRGYKSTSGGITISAVDLNKTIPFVTFNKSATDVSHIAQYAGCEIYFGSSTNLTIAGSYTANVYWQVASFE